jgi:hypothetical protein
MKYDELSDEAKENAVEWMQRTESEIYDGDWVIQEWKETLKYLGFTFVDILWSGFSCQGDGACFTADWRAGHVEPEELIRRISSEQMDQFGRQFIEWGSLNKLDDAAGGGDEAMFPSATLKHEGRYYHENSVQFYFDWEDTDGEEWQGEFEENFTDLCRDIMKLIYKDLEADYDWATGEENAVELICANEYEFDEDGDVVRN